MTDPRDSTRSVGHVGFIARSVRAGWRWVVFTSAMVRRRLLLLPVAAALVVWALGALTATAVAVAPGQSFGSGFMSGPLQSASTSRMHGSASSRSLRTRSRRLYRHLRRDAALYTAQRTFPEALASPLFSGLTPAPGWRTTKSLGPRTVVARRRGSRKELLVRSTARSWRATPGAGVRRSTSR